MRRHIDTKTTSLRITKSVNVTLHCRTGENILLQWFKEFPSCHLVHAVVQQPKLPEQRFSFSQISSDPLIDPQAPTINTINVISVFISVDQCCHSAIKFCPQLTSYSAAVLAKQRLLFVFQLCLRSLGRKPASFIWTMIGCSPTSFLPDSDPYRDTVVTAIVMAVR